MSTFTIESLPTLLKSTEQFLTDEYHGILKTIRNSSCNDSDKQKARLSVDKMYQRTAGSILQMVQWYLGLIQNNQALLTEDNCDVDLHMAVQTIKGACEEIIAKNIDESEDEFTKFLLAVRRELKNRSL